MLGFKETDFWRIEKGALELKPQIDKVVDEVCEAGYSNIINISIGGTWAHSMQMKNIVETYSTIPYFIINAADFVYQNCPIINKDSLVLIESVSGDTQELVEAVKKVKKTGCRILGFVDNPDSPLASLADTNIAHETGVFYKLYFTLLRFMYKAGDFPIYEQVCEEMKCLPEALYEVKKKYDPIAEKFAEEYGDEPLLYFIGAGNTYGGVYSFAMCYLEEMQWMKTKSITGNEFFHGTLEVIERDVPVIAYKGEDYSRPIMERVEKFVHMVSRKVTIIDTAMFELKGISPELRGLMSPFVVQALNERITKHLVYVRRHPLEIRRYYRRLDY